MGMVIQRVCQSETSAIHLAAVRRNGRKRRQQVRAVQALVDKLKREQALAAATHAYPAISCPVRTYSTVTGTAKGSGLRARRPGEHAHCVPRLSL